MNWHVRVHRRLEAERDIESQFDYYLRVEGLPDLALRFVNAVESALEQLTQYPDLGFLCDWETETLRGLRQWPVPGFPKHFLFYRAVDGIFELVRVLHAARDLGEVFEEH